MARDRDIPTEKPFPPSPTSHPILPPGTPAAEPGRDTPLSDDGFDGNGVHPHVRNRPPAEERRRETGGD